MRLFGRRPAVATTVLATVIAAASWSLSGVAAADVGRSQLDFGFGNHGVAVTDFDPSASDVANAVVTLANGSVVVAGQSGSSALMARYTPTGALDQSFGASGSVTFNDVQSLFAIAQDQTGNLTAAGVAPRSPSDATPVLAVVRVTAQGSPDTTFGTNGRITTDLDGATSGDWPSAVITEVDGSVVVGGTDSAGMFAIRYLANGTVDPAFGNGGQVAISLNSIGRQMAMAPTSDGHIIMAGSRQNSVVVVRTQADGSLDQSFGSAGTATIPQDGTRVTDAVVKSDDRIVISAGSRGRTNGSDDFTVLQLTAAGVPDPTFGDQGWVFTDFTDFNGSNTYDIGRDVVLQPDGRIVVTGDDGIALEAARYLPSGALDPSFGDAGRNYLQLSSGSHPLAFAASLSTDLKLVQVGGVSECCSDYPDLMKGSSGQTVLVQYDLTRNRHSRPAIFRNGAWYLRNTTTSGVAQTAFGYGDAGDRPLMCDWDGNGTRTPGVVRAGVWFVTDNPVGGAAQRTFAYGDPGDVPVCGDWDGNGTETPGVFRAGMWFLTNSAQGGVAQMAFGYGDAGDVPIVGDWTATGATRVGVFRHGEWFLRTTSGGGVADLPPFFYGNSDDRPVVGDWDGDGTTTPGVARGGQWLLTNRSPSGAADTVFSYGDPSDLPVVWR